MQLQCENCQKGVNSAGELDGCRCCSKPPPPPSKSARPRYDADAPTESLDLETLRAFQDGKLLAVPKPKLGDLLRARSGLPPEPKPAILQDDFFDHEEHPLFT
jgi:hypothetical protein